MSNSGRGGLGGRKRINIDTVRPQIDAAFKAKKLQEILLDINSGGGKKL